MSDTQHTGPLPDPGWYPDKNGAVRWWDGTAWSNRVRVPQPVPATKPTEGTDSALVLFGWLTTFLMPLIGFILGIVVIAKNDLQGIGMMVLSVVMFFVWSAVLVGM